MPYIIVNIGTGSPVSYTEADLGVQPYDMVWETEQEALDHARNLGIEYLFSHPHLPVNMRTWKPREATPEQVERAKFVGAFGKEHQDAIGTGQSRAHILNPRDIAETHKTIVRKAMEEFSERIGE